MVALWANQMAVDKCKQDLGPVVDVVGHDAKDLVTGGLPPGLLVGVVDGERVERLAVDLDDELPLPPDEVGLAAGHTDVDEGRRDLGVVEDLEATALGVRT